MSRPSELFAVAQHLIIASEGSPAADAMLRRAVSAASYAVFHAILRAAATRFAGAGGEGTAGFAVIYRGFDHGQMKEVTAALVRPTVPERYRNALRRRAVSRDMQDFATHFGPLEEARHLADYDPSAVFTPITASAVVDYAQAALQAFDRTSAEEQADVLALMMVGARD